MSKVRVGIDVGGTHTKAVAIENETSRILGKGSVKTTHDHPKGVAQGVIDAFEVCITNNNIDPKDVIFIAHSTTQATNALLEGDVAKVGLIGIGGGGIGGFLAKRQTTFKEIPLTDNKIIEVNSEYIKAKHVTKDTIGDIVDEMKKSGVDVIVSSKAFGVDDPTEEQLVSEIAAGKDMLTTSASEITKLYGLSTRTKTATLNASILPTMLDTASSTEDSVKNIGIESPLMIMRGDGGVMYIEEMKKRPILTMLSGPAASVSGALMYLRASNAVFVEVGGTSTDISMIKDGKPAVDYSIIGGHRTYVNSLDVRVSGVAGGSMVRATKSGVKDVGPRSAHIAGLEYAAFSDASLFEGAELYTVQPTDSDPDDYVAIRLNDGSSVAITLTCAANALNVVDETDFAKGNYEASYAAVKVLADYIGKSVEETAKDILDISSNKIIPVIEDLIEKYEVEREQLVMIGAGGGAGSLVRHTAATMDMRFQIPENAEVISSIGVALAMVREMVERTIPNPTAQDIADLKQEALSAAISSGAVEDTIEVSVEIDDQAQTVSAIALGSTEVRTTDLHNDVDEDEAREIVLETIRDASPAALELAYSNEKNYVFTHRHGEQNNVRIVDNQGFVKIQRKNGGGSAATIGTVSEVLAQLWEKYTDYSTEIRIAPDIFVIDGAKLIDYSGLSTVDQVTGLAEVELGSKDDEHPIYIVASKNGLR